MLCGRVLLFLAKLLPLTERSGVNLSGGFNTDNATPVEEVAEVGGCVMQIRSRACWQAVLPPAKPAQCSADSPLPFLASCLPMVLLLAPSASSLSRCPLHLRRALWIARASPWMLPSTAHSGACRQPSGWVWGCWRGCSECLYVAAGSLQACACMRQPAHNSPSTLQISITAPLALPPHCLRPAPLPPRLQRPALRAGGREVGGGVPGHPPRAGEVQAGEGHCGGGRCRAGRRCGWHAGRCRDGGGWYHAALVWWL